MASITASNASFSLPLLQDVNYNVSSSFPTPTLLGSVTGSSAAIYYANLQYPTTTKFLVQLNITNPTGVVASAPISASLQDSVDGVTFTNVAIFNPILASNTGTGSTNVQVNLGPLANPYLRAQVSLPASASASGVALGGSYGITTLFV